MRKGRKETNRLVLAHINEKGRKGTQNGRIWPTLKIKRSDNSLAHSPRPDPAEWTDSDDSEEFDVADLCGKVSTAELGKIVSASICST